MYWLDFDNFNHTSRLPRVHYWHEYISPSSSHLLYACAMTTRLVRQKGVSILHSKKGKRVRRADKSTIYQVNGMPCWISRLWNYNMGSDECNTQPEGPSTWRINRAPCLKKNRCRVVSAVTGSTRRPPRATTLRDSRIKTAKHERPCPLDAVSKKWILWAVNVVSRCAASQCIEAHYPSGTPLYPQCPSSWYIGSSAGACRTFRNSS